MLRCGSARGWFSVFVGCLHLSSNAKPRQRGLRIHSTRSGGSESIVGRVLKRNVSRGGRSNESRVRVNVPGGGEEEDSGWLSSLSLLLLFGGDSQIDANSEGTTQA